MLHFNVESTTNIVNQALVQGIRKMMFVSSIAALTRSGDARKEITEEQEWGESKYNSAYGISKYLAETEVWRGIGEGLNAVIINPGIILGPGDWDKGSARLMKVANGEFPFYTNGVTAWVDVADVVRILEQLMKSDVEGERFIVSAGNFAYKDIFTMMAHALHKKPPHIHAGPVLTGLAWRWDTFKSAVKGTTPVLTKETAANASGASVYNSEKLLKVLPAFTYTPIADTIENMARYFMSSL
jgi:nucleoside-diphosphate-sugar epimerase